MLLSSSPPPFCSFRALASAALPVPEMKPLLCALELCLLLPCLASFAAQGAAQGGGGDEAGSPACSAADRAALLSFKAGIVKDTTGILSSWTGPDCCGAWEGVTCHPATGRVTGLQIQRPQSGGGGPPLFVMKGALSPSLGAIQFLEVLVVSGMKQIGGAIPESFSGLSRLTQLYLEDNDLEGPVPSSLGRLTSLKVLSLSRNRLQGRLPPGLGSITGLLQINVGGNLLVGPVPSTYRNLRAMQSLDLSYNMLSGPIPGFVGQYTNLTLLDLSFNQFTGVIPMSLCSLSGALDISLSHNQLTGPIPPQIDGLKSLNTLSLSDNHLTGPIPGSLARLQKVWFLNLSRNGFSGPLPSELQNGLQSLLSIDLSYSGLHLETIPDWMRGRGLRDVRLAGCNIKGNLRPLTAASDSLSTIDLSDNQLTGGLDDFVMNMTVLQEVRLSNNMLASDISRIAIPDSLSMLDLHSNHLHGSLTSLLQKTGTFLEFVDLSNNTITGALPEFNGALALRWLDVSKNRITGKIPSSISNLADLRRLDLSRNQLQGTIPASMSQITNLQWLDLSSNGLSGSIPHSFTSLVSIRHASFRANRFCGQIPQARPFNIFPAAAYAHNSCLCGQPLPPCKTSYLAQQNVPAQVSKVLTSNAPSGDKA